MLNSRVVLSVAGATPRTPVRDKLSINPDEALLDDSEEALKQQEQEIMMQLREELAGLPAPKNDFEIVMPEVSGQFLYVYHIMLLCWMGESTIYQIR